VIVAILTLGVLLFAALVVVWALVAIGVAITRGVPGDAPGLGPPRRARRRRSWWADVTRADWPDGDDHRYGHGDASGGSSCGSGSSCGGGSSSSCGGGSG
jgi:uncharacterized membrane protein YgcG